MPTPKTTETRDDFIKRCTPMMLQDGTAKDEKEAAELCGLIYDKSKKKRTELKIDTTELKNVEVLAAGKWQNDRVKVTEKDLDEMIKNYENGVLEPFLNLDHDDNFTDQVKRALKVVSL